MNIKKCLSNILCVLPFVLTCGTIGFLLYTYLTTLHNTFIVFRFMFSTLIAYGLSDICKMYKLTKELLELNNMK